MLKATPRGGMMLAHFVLIVLLLASHSVAVAASYEIILKNGRSLKTSLYWREGEEIHFFIYGGEMGLPISAVKEIRRLPDRSPSGSPDDPQPPRSEPLLESQGDTGTQKSQAVPEPPDLVRRFQDETAAIFHRSQLIPTMGREKLLTYAREAEGLKKRIIKSPVAQHLNPTLLQLEELLEHLEDELEGRP